MPRHPHLLPAGIRISDNLTFAQLHRMFPLNVVQESLKAADKATIRNRELPNELMTYYPSLLCLYRDVSQQEVLRVMADGLTWLFGLNEFKITGKSGISQARTRVGSEPLKEVFHRCAKPLAKAGAKGCFYQDFRLVALDGSDLDLDDCPENAKYFGKSKNQHGDGAFPKAKIVALMEIGTRAAFAVSIGTNRSSENALALDVIPKLEPSSLCLADQLFMSWKIFDQAKKTGAQLLFRARLDRVLPVEERLSDYSYLSTIYDSDDKKRTTGIKVRVLEYDIAVTRDRQTTVHEYRLITTLMDETTYPLRELASLYHERWEIETMLDEVKTHLMNSQPLRSRTPELVKQEIYGMMMAHYAIRSIMYEAAAMQKIDPDELSFTHSQNVIVRYLPKLGAFSPSTSIRAYV